jgi:hypothetical protein
MGIVEGIAPYRNTQVVQVEVEVDEQGGKVTVSLDSTAVTEREENQSKRSLHTAPITGGKGEG